MLILCCSCCQKKSKQQIIKENYEFRSDICQKQSGLFELSFPNEYGDMRTHQFIVIHVSYRMNGIAHWPDCKYCKERGL